jgi:pimeloyl-ACP methyl ester carboxylesterase
MRKDLEADRDAFLEDFITTFFSADDDLKVPDEQREKALTLCKQSDQEAALGCMDAFSRTDFRTDLAKITVPTLVIHGDSDVIVPFEGSGRRTHDAIEGSVLVVLEGAPHGCNVSHASEFNAALLEFLGK